MDIYFVEWTWPSSGPQVLLSLGGNWPGIDRESCSPDIFCAATLLRKHKHYSPSANDIKQIHYIPPKMSPTKKEPFEAGSFTQFFPAYGFGNPQTYKIKNTSNGKTIGLWMSFGYLLDFFKRLRKVSRT